MWCSSLRRSFTFSLLLVAEVESSRAYLALRTHFEVLGLEAHKFSKMSYLRLEDSTFFVSLKMCHGHIFFYFTLEIGQNLAENLERVFFSGGRLKKIFGELFCGGKTLAPCVLGLGLEKVSSRSRSLALASDFFVSLASKVASSTPPLQNSKTRFGHLFYYL